jgi:hypothetical protein
VPHPNQLLRFLNDVGGRNAVDDFPSYEFQRSRDIEQFVARLVDLAERPFTQLADENEVSPPFRVTIALRLLAWFRMRGAGTTQVVHRHAVRAGNAFDDAKLVDQPQQMIGSILADVIPVDRAAVDDRLDEPTKVVVAIFRRVRVRQVALGDDDSAKNR